MKIYTISIFVIFLCFTTCTRDETRENLCYSSTLINQVNSGDLAVHGLSYNSNCLIYESTEPFRYKRFSYDSRSALKRVEVAYSFNPFSCVMIPGLSQESDPRKARISEYSDFEYDDASRLTKKSNYYINNRNSELTSYETYDYEGDKIIKISSFTPDGQLIRYHDYTYDDRGNITRDDHYMNIQGIKLYMTTTYEFDDKNNPFRVFSCEGNPGIHTNRNNIIKETSVNFSNSSESVDTKLYVYEYNSIDYPVRINDLDCIYGK